MGSGRNRGEIIQQCMRFEIDKRVEGRIASEQALLGSLAAGRREICRRRGCSQAKRQEDKKKGRGLEMQGTEGG